MKTKLFLSIVLLCVGILSCDNEDKITDPIFEFVSFTGDTEVSLNEFTNSTEGYPLVVQLSAFKPYPDDIDITIEVDATNAQEGVDFTFTPNANVKISAGNLRSDTVWIKTVDNAASDDERAFEITLKAASKADVNIGFGIAEPKNASITFTVLDDECPQTPSIYTSDLVNSLDWGYDPGVWNEEDVQLSATGTSAADHVTVTGDLIYYGSLYPAGETIILTLAPDSPGATRGNATFGEKLLGTATDGYDYKLLEVGQGRYDVCSGTISVSFDFLYLEGGVWKHSYFVRSVFSIP